MISLLPVLPALPQTPPTHFHRVAIGGYSDMSQIRLLLCSEPSLGSISIKRKPESSQLLTGSSLSPLPHSCPFSERFCPTFPCLTYFFQAQLLAALVHSRQSPPSGLLSSVSSSQHALSLRTCMTSSLSCSMSPLYCHLPWPTKSSLWRLVF